LGSLLVIRHGQASFHDEEYDKLSERGVEQSRRLGVWLAHQWRPLDLLACGPLRRQRDTARALRDGARSAGATLGEPVVRDAWAEYPAIELLKRGLPLLAERDDEVREILDEAEGELRGLGSVPQFERLFFEIRNAWMSGELALDGVESFGTFSARVREGLAALVDEIGDGRGAVVTSGGPIGLVMRIVLELSDRRAMDMSGAVANTSVSVVRWRRGELELLSYNSLAHLRERELVTFR
jgi:broad specificity phosphatase PhoE